MNIIKHKYGKRTVSLLLAVILVLCPLQVRAADNKPTIEIGDYIQMGTYGGVPIVWRCVAKDSNGPLMLSMSQKNLLERHLSLSQTFHQER